MKRLLGLCVFLLWTATSLAADTIPLTVTAKLLAGYVPFTPTTTIENTTAWKQHRDVMGEQWLRLKPRVDAMNEWRYRAIERAGGTCSTLLYPFSGPDFLNAYTLFPHCNTYIMFGLETPGQVPNFEKMTSQQLGEYFADLRVAFGDLLQRNYFITSNMAAQLNTASFRGVTPMVLAMMGALHLQVESVETVTIQSAKGVKVVFSDPREMVGARERLHTVYYFAQDASNGPLSRNTEFISFISKDKQAHTLIKSASYLLHHEEFTLMQQIVLDTTSFLVQDDTGIPYKHLRSWQQITLYGKYLRPIEIFDYRFQPDLDSAYKTTPSIQPLPFAFGYRWRPDQSGLLTARRW
jgi:hypothetical protein